LRTEGYNDLPSATRRGLLAIATEVLREPMFLLLLGRGAIYIILGDAREALMLLGFVALIIGITLYQEHKTERALESSGAHPVRPGGARGVPSLAGARGRSRDLSRRGVGPLLLF
jgi:Ca2+-transporting ATPase